jgi:hypothetical protein
MKTFETLKTRTGRILKVNCNHNKRHYTIKTDNSVFRTYKMSKDEFSEASYRTGNDWNDFLKYGDYYEVK